jgi:hypothetical protein
MTVPRSAVHGEVFFKAISNLLQVPKMLEGLERWLHSMNDATASDVIAGESPAEAPPPVGAGEHLSLERSHRSSRHYS